MKNRSNILYIVCLVFYLCFVDAFARADIRATIKSASEYDYPSFCIGTKNWKADGFSAELLRAALKEVNLDVEFTDDDLVDKEIIVMQGDNAEEYVKRKRVSPNIISVETYDEAMKLLESGKHDAVMAQRFMDIQLLKDLGISGIVPVKHRLDKFRQDFSFAVRKGDKELLALLNGGLSIVMPDGTSERLYKKWIIPVSGRSQISKKILIYVLIILVLLIVLSVSLRVEVKRKTKKLLHEITEHKKVQEVLQQSDLRYKAFIRNSTEGISCISFEKPLDISLPEDKQIDHIFRYAHFLEANDAYARMLGYEKSEDIIKLYMRDVMPASESESVETLKLTIEKKYNIVDLESVETTRQGERRIFLNNVQGVIKGGQLLRAWVIQRDITRQRQVENELRKNEIDLQKLAGRLISNQEKELGRLARELHDGLTQQLAVMAIEAGNIEQQKDVPASVLKKVSCIKEQLINASKEVHSISRNLHPSILEDLGLERAIKSECSNFSSRTGVAVVFKPNKIPSNLAADISLSIYRIIQESLSNIVKYAQTKNAYVFLEGFDTCIQLSIRDTGIGFDPVQVRDKAALGLGSMRERVRLAHGKFSITSNPGKGTVIEVEIPLKNNDELRITNRGE